MSQSPGYQVLVAKERAGVDYTREFALDVLLGLTEDHKSLPSKYFYDDQGSEYFRQIMAQPEYYPTDCEFEILSRHSRDIATHCKEEPLNLVELGAGDGKKTLLLLRSLVEAAADFRYVPIDISEGAMQTLHKAVAAALPGVDMAGLVAEYADGMHWLGSQPAVRRNLVLFLGSNIGNFNRAKSRGFLRRLWNELQNGDLVLIGFDLKKDIDVLLDAYNDSAGVTAKFNLNLLERINRELGGDFDLSQFRHYGTYNVFSGAMESYLVSLVPQQVGIEALGHSFSFRAWEPVHVEYSYKFLESDIVDMAADTGFIVENLYCDSKRYFADALWRVDKPGVAASAE